MTSSYVPTVPPLSPVSAKRTSVTVDDWSRVMFSDETLIRQFNPTNVSIRRPTNERYNIRYIQPSVRHSASVMMWGAITARGRAGIHLMPNHVTINAERYLEIIKEKVPRWLETRHCTIFMHDGAPCHQARTVKTWFEHNGTQLLQPWPGSSPDLNPIENCWRLLKRKVSTLNPTSTEDLRLKIIRMWVLEITPEYCSALVGSMPRRVAAVLAARGQHTKY